MARGLAGTLCERCDPFDWIVTPLLTSHDWLSPQYPVLMVDTTLMVIMMMLAMTTDRYWPMFASAFALLTVVLHLPFIADPRVEPWALYFAGLVCDFLQLAALAVGTWLEVERPRRNQGVGAMASAASISGS